MPESFADSRDVGAAREMEHASGAYLGFEPHALLNRQSNRQWKFIFTAWRQPNFAARREDVRSKPPAIHTDEFRSIGVKASTERGFFENVSKKSVLVESAVSEGTNAVNRNIAVLYER